MIKLPVFMKRNIHKCLCNRSVPVLVQGILVPSLNEVKNCKISLGIQIQMITKS